MLAAGWDLEAALAAGEAFEAQVVPMVPTLTARQARNARYYEKQKEARLKSSETSESKTPKTVSDDPKTVKTLSDAEQAPLTGERAQVVTLTSSLRSEGTQEANASFVDASKPAEPEKPKTKPPKASRGTRLPDDWEPSEADVEVARAEGLTDEEIRRAALEFRNYWCARTRDATKLSWSRTWHNRVLEIADRKRGRGPRLVASSAQPGGGGRGAVSFADIYARRHGYTSD
jgi:hypothetical protein